ncbi:polyribonucleotide nucleotidyltransferase [Gammaproteobacteria bacterium]|nr:polyribonucleotide nucleotidyltransferase [Gammaproteobacteria bacterium]
MKQHTEINFNYCGKEYSLTTGLLANQATADVLLSVGDTRIHAVVSHQKPTGDTDFFPLLVQVLRRHYASGSISGGHIKRENTRGSETEIIASRLIDRALRPLFPDGYKDEIQIFIEILSTDPNLDIEIPCFLAASAALSVAPLPFSHLPAAIRIGYVNNTLIANPSAEELAQSQLNLLLAGKPSNQQNDIVMIEAQAHELDEPIMLEAFNLGLHQMTEAIEGISKFQAAFKQSHPEFAKPSAETAQVDTSLDAELKDKTDLIYDQSKSMHDKTQRRNYIHNKHQEIIEELTSETVDADEISASLDRLRKQWVRTYMLSTSSRVDGRDFDTVRPISTQLGLLPRVHGDALFRRGETSALVTTTLASLGKGEYVEHLSGKEDQRRFMLFYNFPAYSVGEVGRMGPPKRREIGHGFLARRAVEPLLPSEESFPYTLRVVSEIMACNGSSSMASVCGASLSLMQAGVPLKRHVAGIAMGLILDEQTPHILTDILGDEDHLGDMDLKVAGTTEGITALQMDIKIDGITQSMLKSALEKAKAGRITILDAMNQSISQPNELSDYAPRMNSFNIKTDKIREVIGKGGAVIRGLIEQYGVEIDITDEGVVTISAVDGKAGKDCKKHILDLVSEIEPGQIFNGKITKILEFGAVVALPGNKDGFLHISQISHKRVHNIRDYLTEDQELQVQVSEIDRNNKVRLSIKELSSDAEGAQED